MRVIEDAPRPIAARRAARPVAKRQARKIFVAYPYSFPKADYRRPYQELEKAFGVKFEFADDRITNSHLLKKVMRMIVTSRFSLFDITTWNPNVTLELGIAVGRSTSYYLLFNPNMAEQDAPSDLGGIDRLEYTSYAELGKRLSELLAQEYGLPTSDKPASGQEQMEAIRDAVRERVAVGDGPKVGDIATHLKIATELTKAIVRQMAETGEIETTGQTRGVRYWPVGARR
ncbi:MAG: hypothetical protein WA687_06450 [Solirubrobacterales bacterium]